MRSLENMHVNVHKIVHNNQKVQQAKFLLTDECTNKDWWIHQLEW